MDNAILEELERVQFPLDRRINVKRSQSHRKRGFLLGKVMEFLKGYRVSTMTKAHPELARLLCRWMRRHHPGFPFTTIQVNKGACALHRDKLNRELSVVKGFGRYRGGEFWTMERPFELLDIRRRGGLVINGNAPHLTLPYAGGERYSVVFFSAASRHRPMPEAERRFLRALGFPREPRRREPSSHLERGSLRDAAALLRRLGVPRSAIGDYTNRGIRKDKVSPRDRKRRL